MERKLYVGASKAQREWTLKRDNYTCKNPDDSIACQGEVQVHHILPGLHAIAVLGLTRLDINKPDLLISQCEAHHCPPTGIHLNPNEIKERKKNGQKYWNDKWDKDLHLVATGRTLIYQYEGGDPFPYE